MTSRGTGSDGTVAVGPWLLQLMTLAGERICRPSQSPTPARRTIAGPRLF